MGCGRELKPPSSLHFFNAELGMFRTEERAVFLAENRGFGATPTWTFALSERPDSEVVEVGGSGGSLVLMSH